MAEDFRIQVETDLDTAKAEQKLNALLKEKRQIKLDIDINNQNIKNISKNIEKGIKNTKIDTSAITKQLADSFNITDKSVLKNLNKQLNSMVTNLGKTWKSAMERWISKRLRMKTLRKRLMTIRHITGIMRIH